MVFFFVANVKIFKNPFFPTLAAAKRMQLYFLDHILILLLGVFLPVYSLLRRPGMPEEISFDSAQKKALYRNNSLMLWIVPLIIFGLWYWGGRSFDVLGFSLEQKNLTEGLVWSGLLMLLYALDFWQQVSTPAALAATRFRWQRHTPFMPANYREYWYYVPMAATAAISEEIIFRGYFLNYAFAFWEDAAKAGAIGLIWQAVAFGAVHIYQGWRSILKVFVMAMLTGQIFLATGSLLIPVLLHFFIDMFGGWWGIRLMREK